MNKSYYLYVNSFYKSSSVLPIHDFLRYFDISVNSGHDQLRQLKCAENWLKLVDLDPLNPVKQWKQFL